MDLNEGVQVGRCYLADQSVGECKSFGTDSGTDWNTGALLQFESSGEV